MEPIFKYPSFVKMNLHAHTWRKMLLGSSTDIFNLRTIKLTMPNVEELPAEEINRDLGRTFPEETFFVKHTNKIRNVLLWYAHTNTAVPYCQCFTFLAFVMYKHFYENDKRHAMIDTYYSMHRMILIIKPLLPKSANDGYPLKFAQTLESVILLDVMREDRLLYDRLKDSVIIKMVILNGFSCYYLNWFSSDYGAVLLTFIIEKKSSMMFQRLLNFTVAFFLVHKSIFLGFTDDRCLEMLHEKELVNFYATLWKAKSLALLP